MTVSVVIPTYNRSAVIGRALRSVAAQSYTDYEVIVVDDGSTDETSDVVRGFHRAFGDRLRYKKLDGNQGGAAARNAGFAIASGRYIALLDADDEWRPTKLRIQVDRFAQLPAHIGLLTTRYIRLDANGCFLSENPPHPHEGDLSAPLVDMLEGRREIVGAFSTLMCRKDVFERVSLDETLRCWHDADFYFRAAKEFQFAFVSEVLTVKYEPQDAISASWRIQAEGQRRFWNKYGPVFGARGEFRRYMAGHRHMLGRQACLSGDLREGRRLLRESFEILPTQWRLGVDLGLSFTGRRGYATAWAMRERLRARSV